MKTIEEIKHQVAVENGYKDWIAVLLGLTDAYMFKRLQELENEVAEAYAKQCCESQKEHCALMVPGNMVYKEYREDLHEIILSTPNVAEKP